MEGDTLVITIGAMIGAGKSSLAKILGEHLGSEVFYESVEDNPILPLFYTATPEEIEKNRYPFLLQLYFLNTRFQSIKRALVHKNNVLDRSIYEDWYFAKVNKELGRINDLEFQLYENLLNNMLEELEELPKKAPGYELDESLVEYYHVLWSGYDEWIDTRYKASEVVKIDIDKYDYVNNMDDRKKVLKMITDKLTSVRGE